MKHRCSTHSFYFIFLAALSVLLLSNCATFKPMALQFDAPPQGESTSSLCIFTLDTKNLIAPEYKPAAYNFQISDRDNVTVVEKYRFDKPVNAGDSRSGANKYLVSIQLKPGQYILSNVKGGASNLLINGNFNFNTNVEIDIPEPGIFYLGHMQMINRDKREGEPRSGPVLPLIDQAVTGFSKGTFDIKVTDDSDADIQQFIQTYPWLRNKPIDKALMVNRPLVK